jgi:protein TonB
MLVIVAVHVALLAAVMSAKMEIQRHREPPIVTIPIHEPTVPPPHPITQRAPHTPQPLAQPIEMPRPQNPVSTIALPPVDLGPKIDTRPLGALGTAVIPETTADTTSPAKSGPRLITSSSELKPPYPASKLLNEEEAVLTLRLTIDANGRVVAVDPVGRADPVFLEAARRHLIAHWRYAPAQEGGRAVVSTTVITLHFELDG